MSNMSNMSNNLSKFNLYSNSSNSNVNVSKGISQKVTINSVNV
jgi:hypothetical protein